MRTPLYQEHLGMGAQMTEFAGWEMPLYYNSIVREVRAVRSTAGLFDLSHMGEIWVEGPYALDTLQFVTTNDVSALAVGQAQYTLLCDDSGGILDDLIVYRVDNQSYLLVVNASNSASDFEWIKAHNDAGATLENRSEDTALIAVQGPSASAIFQNIARLDVTLVKRFHGLSTEVAGVKSWVARTGYTGEDGFEIFVDSDQVAQLWTLFSDEVQRQSGLPAGLGARDVLRLEAGYPLYGHELTRSTTPVDARLMWTVRLEKDRFIGKEAILAAREAGPSALLVGLAAAQGCIPRHGYRLVADGGTVGTVTSGTFSPTLQRPIAMAYVEPSLAEPGTNLDVLVRERACPCEVVPMAFYRNV